MGHHDHDKHHHDKHHDKHGHQHQDANNGACQCQSQGAAKDGSFGREDTGKNEQKEWMDGLSDDE